MFSMMRKMKKLLTLVVALSMASPSMAPAAGFGPMMMSSPKGRSKTAHSTSIAKPTFSKSMTGKSMMGKSKMSTPMLGKSMFSKSLGS